MVIAIYGNLYGIKNISGAKQVTKYRLGSCLKKKG